MEDISLFLAKLFGVYLLVMALAVLVNKDRYKDLIKKKAISTLEWHLMGMMGVLGGLLIVLNHNIWSGWPIVITLMGWIALVKGATALIMPNLFMKFTKDMGFENALSLFGFAGLMLGTFFIYIGFFV